MNKLDKIYVMENKVTKVTIECTKDFVLKWITRGFEVVEIKVNEIKGRIDK